MSVTWSTYRWYRHRLLKSTYQFSVPQERGTNNLTDGEEGSIPGLVSEQDVSICRFTQWVYWNINGEWAHLLRLTVEPSARSSVKPSPPGTVKPLILTVVQLEALEASLIELMVTVQSSARFFGAADTWETTPNASNNDGSIMSWKAINKE